MAVFRSKMQCVVRIGCKACKFNADVLGFGIGIGVGKHSFAAIRRDYKNTCAAFYTQFSEKCCVCDAVFCVQRGLFVKAGFPAVYFEFDAGSIPKKAKVDTRPGVFYEEKEEDACPDEAQQSDKDAKFRSMLFVQRESPFLALELHCVEEFLLVRRMLIKRAIAVAASNIAANQGKAYSSISVKKLGYGK